MFQLILNSDARLVRAALAGHQEPFGELVLRYLPAVHAIAYARTRNHTDAEDVAQEAFIKAYRSLDSLREPGRFRAWLIGIARHTASTWIETHHRQAELAKKATEGAPVAEPNIEQRELQAILWREVDALDEPSREVLLLYYQAGHSTKEIAALVNASNDAVRKRLQRARERLGTRMLDVLGMDEPGSEAIQRRGAKIMSAIVAAGAPWLATKSAAAATIGAATIAKAAVGLLVVGVITTLGVMLNSDENELASGEPVEVASEPIESEETAPVANQQPTASSAPPSPIDSEPLHAELPAGSGTIYGQVFDLNGDPAAGVAVTAYQSTPYSEIGPVNIEGVRTATSGLDGRFTLRRLPADGWGANRFLVHATTDFASVAKEVYLSSTDWHLEQVRIRLQLKPIGTITGRVRDTEGNAIPEAKITPERAIRVEQLAHRYTNSDSSALYSVSAQDGSFTLDMLWEGLWNLIVSADGYNSVIVDGVQTGVAGVEAVLGAGATFSARVVREDTDEPLSNFPVVAQEAFVSNDINWRQSWFMFDYKTTTDDFGYFILRGVSGGTIRLHLRDVERNLVGDPAQFVIGSGTNQDAGDLHVFLGAVVRGMAVEAESNEPISAYRIDARIPSFGDRDGLLFIEKGGFELAALLPGDRRIAAYTNYHSGQRIGEIELTLESGETADDVVIVTWQTDVDIPRFSGRVVDPDGRPIANARVTRNFEDGDSHSYGPTRTDALGQFEILVEQPAKAIALRAWKFGMAMRDHGPVYLHAHESEPIVLTLHPEAIVRGVVMDPKGVPVSNLTLRPRLAPEDGGSAQRFTFPEDTTLANGRFEFTALPPGRFSLFIDSYLEPDSQKWILPEDFSFEVGAGEVIENLHVPVTIGGSAYVVGQVRDQMGQPISGAMVSISSRTGENPRYFKGFTNDDGAFRWEHLAPGEYWIDARHEDHSPRLGRTVNAPIGVVVMTLDEMPIVVGHVLNAETKRPVESFTIHAGLSVQAAYSMRGFSDPSGNFEIPLRFDGDASFTVTAHRYQPRFVRITDLVPGKRSEEQVITLEPGWELAGLVTDTKGTPVANAQIYIGYVPRGYRSDLNVAGFTDQQGAFVLSSLKPDVQRIGIAHPAYASTSVALDEFDGVVVLQRPGRVEGVVSLGDEPLSAAEVRARPLLEANPPHVGTTNDEGRYVIPGIPLGEVEISVVQPTGVEIKRRVQVEADSTTMLDVALPLRHGAIGGIITVDGVPVDSERVGAMLSGVSGEYAYTSQVDAAPDGQYRFDYVPPGPAQLHVTGAKHRESWSTYHAVEEVVVLPGQETTIDIDLESGEGSLRVVVTDKREGAVTLFRLLPGHDWPAYGTLEIYEAMVAMSMYYTQSVDSEGKVVPNLPPGDYTALVASIDNAYTAHTMTAIEHARFELHPIILEEGEQKVLELKSP